MKAQKSNLQIMRERPRAIKTGSAQYLKPSIERPNTMKKSQYQIHNSDSLASVMRICHRNTCDNHPRAATSKTTTTSRSAAKMLSAITCCSALLIFLQLISCAKGQQYQRPPPVSLSQAQNLVNIPHEQQQSYHTNLNSAIEISAPALALPLMRPPQTQSAFQSADLDNVIESTTAATSLNVNMLASTYNSRQFQQQQQQTTCQLPPTWAGKWYQANKEPIRVTNTEISDKGVCRDKKGDKYLFEQVITKQNANLAHNTNQASSCLICMVINERHLNVLQYKESTCQPIPAKYLNKSQNHALIIDNDHSLLDSICSDITGDAQLESLFRLDTPSIECPINGKFQFSYDTCREPQSSLDSCIDKKQLHFKFSACPEMASSESKSEVLKCYADWSEGNNYYMIGRLENASNQQDKGKFRCFLYEKSPAGYIQMAQSLEESCHDLISVYEGPKTLRLTPRQPSSNKCHLPSYIQSQSENWLSVDNSLIYMFNQNATKFQVKETKEGNVIEEATCLQQITYPAQIHPHSLPIQTQARYQAASRTYQQQQVTTPTSRRYPPSSNHFNQIDQSSQQTPSSASSSSRVNDVVYLVQITKNCYTTDYCVRFHRRTSGIVQIDYFIALPGGDGQQRCRNAYIGTPQTQIITSTNLEQQRCPFEGAYSIEAPPEADYSYNPSNIFVCPRQSYLLAQCEQPTHLRIHYRCSSTTKNSFKNLYCLGSWTTNGLVRLILADDERHRYSAWYKDYGLLTGSNSISSDQIQGDQMDQAGQLTRSQQLLGMAQPISSSSLGASIVDLQIALITALPTIAKPMQVRLTRRNQCSEVRGYANQGSFSSSISSFSSVPSYASPSATSGAIPTTATFGYPWMTLLMVLVTLSMLQMTTTSNRRLLVRSGNIHWL